MSAETPAIYDESKIVTLSSLDHIRLRPGMYIGRLGNGSHRNDGIYVLLKEIIDNSVDEFIMGHGKRIQITIENNRVSLRDFGRGIPLGKVVECVSVINTGAKYNDDVFQFSVGLNGVGTKAVNALSQSFRVCSIREQKKVEVLFEQGSLKHALEPIEVEERNGTFIEFTPDSEIFSEYTYDLEIVRKQLWNYAYLNRKLSLFLNKECIKSNNGLLDLLDKEVETRLLYDIIHDGSGRLEYAFTHTERYGEEYFSFVNGHYTNDGGTHLSAFREGILKGVNLFFKSSFQATDIRDGIVGCVAVKIQEPIFESQTKNKLGNTDVRSWIVAQVRESLVDFLYKNSKIAEALKHKVQSNERVRKELSSVKKAARERSRKSTLTLANLKDCKEHYNNPKNKRGSESMIFLTEGQSAGGSIITSRDVKTQAVFCLKGKPLNCWGMGKACIYKNQELFNVMKTLGIENSIDDLRYNKVILATDADVDGLHIRNLLLTFFLCFFEELVLQNHLYILETPLFRVRNTQNTRYCYSNAEKEVAMQKLKGKGLEVTRFKGLGEISPKEFAQFIGPQMRALLVEVDDPHEVPNLLSFYMGGNTAQRKQYIIDHLIS